MGKRSIPFEKTMNNEDRYRQTRTLVEDWIEAHKEMCKIYKWVMAYCEQNQLQPSVHLFETIKQLLPIRKP